MSTRSKPKGQAVRLSDDDMELLDQVRHVIFRNCQDAGIEPPKLSNSFVVRSALKQALAGATAVD